MHWMKTILTKYTCFQPIIKYDLESFQDFSEITVVVNIIKFSNVVIFW